MIVKIRVGWESIIVGPRAAFVGPLSGAITQDANLASEDEARRRLCVALSDPALAERLRRAFDLWQCEAHRITEASDRSIIDRVARLTRNGTLAAFVVPDAATKYERADFAGETALEGGGDAAASVAAQESVSMDLRRRMAAVLQRVPERLTGPERDGFLELVAPTALNPTASALAYWAMAPALGAGAILDTFLTVGGAQCDRPTVREGVRKLRQALELIVSARNESDLNLAARVLADFVASVGAPLFRALVGHTQRKQPARWGEKKASVRSPPPAPPQGPEYF